MVMTERAAVRPEDAALVYQLIGRHVADADIAKTLRVPVEALHAFYRQCLAVRLSSRQGRGALSPQEERIIPLVTQGLRHKDIAIALGISVNTVRVHMGSIYQIVGVRGKLELALWAKENGY